MSSFSANGSMMFVLSSGRKSASLFWRSGWRTQRRRTRCSAAAASRVSLRMRSQMGSPFCICLMPSRWVAVICSAPYPRRVSLQVVEG